MALITLQILEKKKPIFIIRNDNDLKNLRNLKDKLYFVFWKNFITPPECFVS